MRFGFIIFLLFVSTNLWSQNTSVLPIQIPYNNSDIIVDGNLDEWNNYYQQIFVDTGQRLHNAPGHQLMAFFDESYDYSKTFLPLSRNTVDVRICWDISNLYFGFIVHDSHLWAQNIIEGKYPELHLNDGTEIYIDTKNDSGEKMDINDYQFMIDISGLNLVFRGDRELIASDSFASPKKSGQNIFFQYHVQVNGMFNDTLADTGYTTEVLIPFAAIGLTPKTGMKIRLEVCNNDNDYNLDGIDSYDKKALRYWPFNWLGYCDFGYPDTWVTAQLAGEPKWFDKLSGNKIRSWFTFYAIALIITVLIISLLLLRMKRIKRLPARVEIKPSKVVYIKKQNIEPEPVLSDNDKILRKASDFLTKHYQENIGSEKLAKHLAVSIRTLQRITREELDVTPTNFIYMVKLNLAADFLKNHKGNVSETAYEFGFSDPGYFSKLFKKHFGVSPIEYMEKNDTNL